MSYREIALHLALLLGLVVLGIVLYSFQKGPTVVPQLIAELQGDNVRHRESAIRRLEDLGPAARAAAPTLLAIARDLHSGSASSAAAALRWIDLDAAQEAMQSALQALQTADMNGKRRAAEILGNLGLLAKPAVPALMAATHDADGLLRDRSLSALGYIGVPSAEIVPLLAAALSDPADHVRHAAMAAISFGLPSAAALLVIPALQRLEDDPTPAVRQLAHFTRERLERANLDVELKVAAHSLKRDVRDREYTLQRLAKLGPAGAGALPEVTAQLTHESALIRYLAVQTIAEMGPAARASADALRARREDPEPLIRKSAEAALAALGEK